ncbi:MAG: NERD domain-containing protein [Actinobacteria bacterium]|nr:NERD domain-containing protein [Actinomycetota bacterium]
MPAGTPAWWGTAAKTSVRIVRRWRFADRRRGVLAIASRRGREPPRAPQAVRPSGSSSAGGHVEQKSGRSTRSSARANIDHLAITPGGVWVTDAKRYRGALAKRDVGGWFRTDVRLYVGRRDCTKLDSTMAKQVASVRMALDGEWVNVPTLPILCFVEAGWGWFAKPIRIDGWSSPGRRSPWIAEPTGLLRPRGCQLSPLAARLKPARLRRLGQRSLQSGGGWSWRPMPMLLRLLRSGAACDRCQTEGPVPVRGGRWMLRLMVVLLASTGWLPSCSPVSAMGSLLRPSQSHRVHHRRTIGWTRNSNPPTGSPSPLGVSCRRGCHRRSR